LLSVAFQPDSTLVTGLQFDVQYDSSVIGLSVTVGDAARSSEKNLFLSDLTPNRRRFMVVGFNRNAIPAGTVVNLFANVKTSAPTGAYALTLSNVQFTSPDGHTVPSVSTDGSIAIAGPSGPRLQAAGVLNAASLLGGPVAPGEIVTLIGSEIGPAMALQPDSGASNTVLGDTRVLFDGVPAPLLYAATNQINAVVPYGIEGRPATQVTVTSANQVLAGLSLPVAAASPSVFALDATGTGPGAILNQDSSINTPWNAAARGSIIAIYATGAGQTDPPGVDGRVAGEPLPIPVLPVSVRIGGLTAEVLYRGAAPGLISGALQVNCRIPDNVVPGFSVPVQLNIGTATSPAGVTVAVR
jgi:uncharacterized protein (TIGR03437 family)